MEYSKKELIASMKENGCSICGYNKCKRSLVFHHANPVDKVFEIHHHLNIQDLFKELNKCILLCANCHGEIHEKE